MVLTCLRMGLAPSIDLKRQRQLPDTQGVSGHSTEFDTSGNLNNKLKSLHNLSNSSKPHVHCLCACGPKQCALFWSETAGHRQSCEKASQNVAA